MDVVSVHSDVLGIVEVKESNLDKTFCKLRRSNKKDKHWNTVSITQDILIMLPDQNWGLIVRLMKWDDLL